MCLLRFLLIAMAFGVLTLQFWFFASLAGAAPGTFLVPCDTESFVYQKITPNATYEETDFTEVNAPRFFNEQIIIVQEDGEQPLRNTHEKNTPFTSTYCTGNENFGINHPQHRVPDDFVYNVRSSNGIVAFFSTSGEWREYFHYEYCSLGAAHGSTYFFPSPALTNNHSCDATDFVSANDKGGHRGTDIFGFPFALRLAEAELGTPIEHTLSINLPGDFISSNNNGIDDDFVWPAKTCDTGCDERYRSTTNNVVAGSLLALRPQDTNTSLGITTELGGRIADALRTFGAFVVDISTESPELAGNPNFQGWSLAVEAYGNIRTFVERVQVVHGINMNALQNVTGLDSNTQAFYDDLYIMYENLFLVTNNSKANPKGPPADPISCD